MTKRPDRMTNGPFLRALFKCAKRSGVKLNMVARAADIPARRALLPAGNTPAVLGAQGLTPHRRRTPQRQTLYAFAAVSTHDGVIDSLVLPWANAETMQVFLAEMARRHAVDFIMMVMDQAGWHIAGHLDVPQNMRLEFLPALS